MIIEITEVFDLSNEQIELINSIGTEMKSIKTTNVNFSDVENSLIEMKILKITNSMSDFSMHKHYNLTQFGLKIYEKLKKDK